MDDLAGEVAGGLTSAAVKSTGCCDEIHRSNLSATCRDSSQAFTLARFGRVRVAHFVPPSAVAA